jgi:hypothetical protein
MTAERKLGPMQTSRIVSTFPSYLSVMVKSGLLNREQAKALEMTTAWNLFQRLASDKEVSAAVFSHREKSPLLQGSGGVFSSVPIVDAVLSEFSRDRLCALRTRLLSTPRA